jgi:hypothetical protein
MIDRIGPAIATADGGVFQADQVRYRGLAVAALKPLADSDDVGRAFRLKSATCSD